MNNLCSYYKLFQSFEKYSYFLLTVPFDWMLINPLLWNIPEHSDTCRYVQNKLM